MIRVVNFNHQGDLLPVFIDDTDTGYTGKDVLTRPGVFDEVATDGLKLPIAELQGSIDGYSTKCMALLAVDTNMSKQIQDCTAQVKQLLTVPETAAKMLIAKMSEDEQEFLNSALEVIHFYEGVTPDTKVFLPEEAFQFVSPDIAKKMRSTRHVYVLKSIDNQEIVQKTHTDVYGVVLPTVEEVHGVRGVAPNSLDILRVVAPCRKELSPGVFKYNSIYHTPHYRVDPKIRGMVPSHLEWLTGYSRNDMLDIQPFERHMYDNLYTFVCSDTARYVSEITTGILLMSPFGKRIMRIVSCKNTDMLLELVSDLSNDTPEGIECTLTYTEVQNLISSGIEANAIAHLIRNKLNVDNTALIQMIAANSIRVVDIENLPFVMEFSDEFKEQLTEALISNKIVSRAVYEYLLQLCCRAYDVNWGHTGACEAIPGLNVRSSAAAMDEVMTSYMNVQLGKSSAPAGADFSALYPAVYDSSDEEGFLDEDEAFANFKYYVTDDTMQKIRTDTLAQDFFTGGVSGAETTESSIVQYWRKVNGDSGLNYFISSAFSVTGDISILFEAFAKLMRWGDLKPALLVFHNHPEIRTVFDLNTGKEIPNTAIVDESKLVLKNGCSYSLDGVVTCKGVIGANDAIVGFRLCRDYGVKKYYLASWVDIGEMVVNSEIDIAELKGVTTVPLSGAGVYDITEFANAGYQFHTSKRNIELGLECNVLPANLSELALLTTPGVLGSAGYLKSKQSKMAVTTKDRQYQILASYCAALRELYSTEAASLSGEAITTVDLSSLAVKVYELYINGAKSQAPSVNDVRAQQAVSALNLDLGPSIQYSDAPLNGKFTLVSDMDMASDLPAITFTDAQVASVAHRVRDRVVMLVLETPTEFILCRKDITAGEVRVSGKSIDHKRYTIFEQVVRELKNGRPVKIRYNAESERKPVYIHRTLEEFM